MIDFETKLNAMRLQGRADALDLRNRAADMDGTAIIAEEEKIPQFDGQKDYSAWKVGAPVYEIIDGERQIFTLMQPYNAANYSGTPSTLPAIWSIRHTKDPKKAKPWLAPNGTSGLYMKDECCTENGKTWSSTQDNNPYSPSAYPLSWNEVNV
jgi:hypothetical protein